MISEVKNMDCMLGMKGFPDNYFDLAIVDPPYGLDASSVNGAGKLKNRILNKTDMSWDFAPDEEYFFELFRVAKNKIIWGANYFEQLPPSRGIAIWDKEQPFENFSAFEYCWTSFDKPAKIFRLAVTRTGEEKIHPTQKPVNLYKWLLHNYATKGDKILDTHLGSGSSRIAAYNMGFDFWGFEISKHYFESQEKRFKNQTAQLKMFVV